MALFRHTLIARLMIMVLAFSTATLPAVSSAEDSRYSDELSSDPSAELMIVDTFLVRPLTLAATVIGAATWVVALPFTAVAGKVGRAGETLVAAPAKYTFNRPLGEFEDRGFDR